MSRYKAYPGYKDSEGDWLGKAPDNWTLMQAKFSFVLQRGHDLSSDEMIQGDYLVYGSNGPIGTHNSFTTEGPSITVGRSGSVGEINFIDQNFWAHNTSLYVKDFKGSPPKFVYYLLTAINPKRLSAGSAVGTLDRNNIHSQIVANPSFEEQLKIANFLDHETAKIDTLIAKQRELIKLLKEKRQAVISHAVTKGLNPNAPMRNSGVEWLGEVPKHWEVTRLKHRTILFEQGWSPQCDSRPAEAGEFGVLKVGCVNYGQFNSTENKALPIELMPQLQYLIKKNDLLISRANTKELVGSAAVVKGDFDNLILCDKLYRLRFESNVEPQWVSFYLSLPIVRQQIELEASGASHSMQNIGQSSIKELSIVFPPHDEAIDIIKMIEEKTNVFDICLIRAARQIELLQERRTAIISAAVTGKIDVRDWQASGDKALAA